MLVPRLYNRFCHYLKSDLRWHSSICGQHRYRLTIIQCRIFTDNTKISGYIAYARPRVARDYTATERGCSRLQRIVDHHFDKQNKNLLIRFGDGTEAVYPFIYVLDGCRCEACLQGGSLLDGGRRNDVYRIPASLEYIDDGSEIRIVWADGHESCFRADWLRARTLPKSFADVKLRNCNGPQRTFWKNDLQGSIPAFSYNELLQSEKTLYSWLSTLCTLGLAVVKESPVEVGQIEKLAQEVGGFTRTFNYGKKYTIKSKPDPTTVAYTGNFLSLHTDTPYFSHVPGVQLLHCIEQSKEGGANLLVDGFHVANALKENCQDAFNVLKTVKVIFRDEGSDAFGDHIHEEEIPVITLDQEDNVVLVRHSDIVRHSWMNATPEDVLKFYEAYYLLVNMMYSKEYMVEYKMEPGDILTMDNHRVVHGRTAYDASKASRWIEGCYIDWDQIYSKMRLLATNFTTSTNY